MTSRGPVAVLGGGISGLTAAFLLQKAGQEVVLFEAAKSPGGVIRTVRGDGWLFEFGPNTVLASRDEIGALIEAAGLSGEMLTAGGASGRRFVVRGGRLVLLPASPPAFFTSGLFSLPARLRVLGEPFIPRFRGYDQSIADFARRRLGGEMLDYAIGPFVSGVYAGDPERLSVRHAVRKIHALEQTHGSLIRGALAQRKAGRKMTTGPRGGLVSFREGLEALPRRLCERLGPAARLGTTVHGIRPGAGGLAVSWSADGASGTDVFPGLIVGLDSMSAAGVMEPLDPDGSLGVARLREIPYAGVAVTALGFRRADVTHPLDGFGFLVPRREGMRLLGCLFVSTLFPGRAPQGHVALTAIVGGATDPGAATLSEAEILSVVLAELSPLLGLKGDPVHVSTLRWPRAIPQYNLGHERFLAVAGALEERHPGLSILGNWRGGVSVGDCIASASELAARLGGARA